MKERIKLMTAKDIAALLNVSKSTIRRYAAEGIIGTYQIGGKGSAVRYYLKENLIHE